MKRPGVGKRTVWLIVAVNVLLITAIGVIVGIYNTAYQEQLREENLSNIENLNQSAANIAASYFKSMGVSLADIKRYAQRKELDHDELLEFIYDSTMQENGFQYELVNTELTGFAACTDENGGFAGVDYSSYDYRRLQKILKAADADKPQSGLSYTPEFTDSYTAIRSLALYTYISLKDKTAQERPYTLMIIAKSESVTDIFNVEGGYSGMSSVLIDGYGDYILGGSAFKDTNFFDFLYSYNDLTLDERNDIARRVEESGAGELFYNDSRGRECVYRYARVSGSSWFCVTAVPVASFHTGKVDMMMTIICAAVMLAMLAVDVAYLRSLNSRLKQSMAMEIEANNAKTEFLSRMSHDIRTPLNGIIGTTVLAMDESNPPATADYLRIIDSSSKFLLGLVNDVLDMSKVESGRMELHIEPYSYGEFREYIDAVIRPLCKEKNIDFQMTSDAPNELMMFDRLRLNQIFFNLLSNSVKFTPQGGTVSLETKRTLLEGGRAALDFTVSDTGIGMSREFQEHMFEPFTQEQRGTKVSGQGTGLGLAIVHNLVGIMGGSIDVKSEENAGTSFFIHLESESRGEVETERKDTGKPEREILRGRRVLLCEDNEINAMITERMLEKEGVSIEVAQNGKEGLDMFAASPQGYYDAVLMDIMMPVMDGLAASRALRVSGHPDAQDVPVIAMTANAYAADVENCINAGMNAHIAKPIDRDMLYDELVRQISKRK